MSRLVTSGTFESSRRLLRILCRRLRGAAGADSCPRSPPARSSPRARRRHVRTRARVTAGSDLRRSWRWPCSRLCRRSFTRDDHGPLSPHSCSACPWSGRPRHLRCPPPCSGGLRSFRSPSCIAGAVLVVKQAGAGAGFIISLLVVVGGVFFPVSVLPDWIEWTSDVQPLTPALDLVRHLVVGTPVDSTWRAIGRLALFAAVLLPPSVAVPPRLLALRAAPRHCAGVLGDVGRAKPTAGTATAASPRARSTSSTERSPRRQSC